MKRIIEIEGNLKAIQNKLDSGANDWNKEEKEHIEKCYFEITKISTGTGRTVDLGCTDCVVSAANLIRNYVALVRRQEAEDNEDLLGDEKDWRDTIDSIKNFAIENAIEIPKEVKKKKDLIEFVESALSEKKLLEEGSEGEPQQEPTREQMIEYIKNSLGDEVDVEDLQSMTDEELLQNVKTLQNGEG